MQRFNEVYNTLDIEIKFLEKAWPKNLPSGIIHADLFRDNVFFDKGQITGVIDFYFSCYHFFLYDLSIVINDWCFENNGSSFNKDLFNSVIQGYNLSRNLEKSEIEAFNLILRVAAVRILVTRLHDFIFHPNDAVVVKKDPYQYLNILHWHQLNKVFLTMINIYTDGACSGNPGIGGWGAVIFSNSDDVIFLNGGENITTNNRMELTAAIKSIAYFENRSNLEIFTDSKYLKDGIERWILNWKKNG